MNFLAELEGSYPDLYRKAEVNAYELVVDFNDIKMTEEDEVIEVSESNGGEITY